MTRSKTGRCADRRCSRVSWASRRYASASCFGVNQRTNPRCSALKHTFHRVLSGRIFRFGPSGCRCSTQACACGACVGPVRSNDDDDGDVAGKLTPKRRQQHARTKQPSERVRRHMHSSATVSRKNAQTRVQWCRPRRVAPGGHFWVTFWPPSCVIALALSLANERPTYPHGVLQY